MKIGKNKLYGFFSIAVNRFGQLPLRIYPYDNTESVVDQVIIAYEHLTEITDKVSKLVIFVTLMPKKALYFFQICHHIFMFQSFRARNHGAAAVFYVSLDYYNVSFVYKNCQRRGTHFNFHFLRGAESKRKSALYQRSRIQIKKGIKFVYRICGPQLIQCFGHFSSYSVCL